jgi:SAM-dependent methyltransferase
VALDVACGLGRNAFLLARRGYRVVAADISRIALLTIDRELASGAEIQCVQFDADGWPFAPECFDLVVQISFLDRRGLTDLRASVRPHGLVLLETFVGDPAADRPGPRSADHRLKYGELARIFGDWEVLRIEERSPPDARAAILVRRPFLDASVR